MGGCYGWLLWVVAMGGCYGWLLWVVAMSRSVTEYKGAQWESSGVSSETVCVSVSVCV